MNEVSIKETFDFLYLNQNLLTVGQADFVAGLKTYYNRNKMLSERQAGTLFDIAKYLKANEPERVTNNRNK
jgi:hypothetical protein